MEPRAGPCILDPLAGYLLNPHSVHPSLLSYRLKTRSFYYGLLIVLQTQFTYSLILYQLVHCICQIFHKCHNMSFFPVLSSPGRTCLNPLPFPSFLLQKAFPNLSVAHNLSFYTSITLATIPLALIDTVSVPCAKYIITKKCQHNSSSIILCLLSLPSSDLSPLLLTG